MSAVALIDRVSPDKELLEACCRGDTNAVNIFYERYKNLIYSAIHAWINKYAKETDRTEDVKEIFQETILDIMKNSFARIRQARDPSRISGLIFLIAYQNAGKYFKKKWREQKRISAGTVTIPKEDDFIDRLTREERICLIEEFKITLSLEEQKIMELRYGEEMKYSEIAEYTGLSISNIGVMISRIKGRLRDFVRKKYGINEGVQV